MDCKGVHVLFCDHDPSAGSETLALLQKCSYKVTTVKSARQVVLALNAEDSDVDIVLADLELPQEKSFKMLKHILGQDNLSHVAVVVMSERDDMAVVAKCLRLGAVDYLVKPLRSNEVLNLWTHMWRRRRMLGLPDKCAVVESTSFHADLPKPGATVDLLSGYHNMGCSTSALNAHPTNDSKDCTPPQLELSLRLSLNYNAEKIPEQAVNVASMPASPVSAAPCTPPHLARYVEPRLQKLMMLNTIGKQKGKWVSFPHEEIPKTSSVPRQDPRACPPLYGVHHFRHYSFSLWEDQRCHGPNPGGFVSC